MTYEYWYSPVLLIPSHEIPLIAAWRPTVTQHAYSETDQRSEVTWLENFEVQMRDASDIPDRLRADIEHLRDVIAGKVSNRRQSVEEGHWATIEGYHRRPRRDVKR